MNPESYAPQVNDLTCTMSSGLIAGASNIVIDLNGKTISGSGEIGYVGMIIDTSDDDNVTVKNGTITKFHKGIISEEKATRVSGMIITGNITDGVSGCCASGLVVSKSTITGNGVGLEADGPGAVIKGNTLSGNVVAIDVTATATIAGNAQGLRERGERQRRHRLRSGVALHLSSYGRRFSWVAASIRIVSRRWLRPPRGT